MKEGSPSPPWTFVPMTFSELPIVSLLKKKKPRHYPFLLVSESASDRTKMFPETYAGFSPECFSRTYLKRIISIAPNQDG